ncbi:deoxyribodipyrimidine photo-lyase [Zavarzinia sp.]|uniref:cryptochrome/photolyase family protein n=1 Tax=Zavarzinia sp. TaxID=2027920 RepID=UPI003567E38C
MPSPDPHSPIIVWFRRDLRLADHPALAFAAATGRPVLPAYILDEATDGPQGAAARWWLERSLASLRRDLAALGAPLVCRRGPPAGVLAELAKVAGAGLVVFNAALTPKARTRDAEVTTQLAAAGIACQTLAGDLLFEPGQLRNRTGGAFKVFTPFWRACLAASSPARPLPAPARIRAAAPVRGEDPAAWGLSPRAPDWAAGFAEWWTPGEAAARDRLAEFVGGTLAGYARVRDRVDQEGTSRLSPHLAFGEIGPRQIWHAVETARAAAPGLEAGAERFLAEIGWREFAHHLLAEAPDMGSLPLQPAFAHFPYAEDTAGLRAWQRGRTGYPIVDAAMRQLWQTGWMHNRLRMIAASFLVKDLLLPWTAGEAWFRDTLLDADPANNAAGWQWVAGCGADAAPYFRVFNPVLQAGKFDPDGAFTRRFVPELAALPAPAIHSPWRHPDLLARHGIRLGRDYPAPIVDHDTARRRALAAFADIRTGAFA